MELMPRKLSQRESTPWELMPLQQASQTIAMVAGEASGDLIGANLISGIRQAISNNGLLNVNYLGIGGEKMKQVGFDACWPSDRLAVRGYVEALKRIPDILSIRHSLFKKLSSLRPDIFIGIDAPDFNLSLEKKLRLIKVPVVHFVSPSIWAWRGKRIKTIAQAVDHMLCIFPFEKAIYDKAGIAATYVGHPLADQIPLEPNAAAARLRLNLNQDALYIGIMPGSRISEIDLIAPTFFAAAAMMQQQRPALRFLVPVGNVLLLDKLKGILINFPSLKVNLILGKTHDVIEASHALLVKSGTSTLEVALFKKPMVISYKVPWLTGQIMRRQGYLPYVGLPNILAEKFVVPELLQQFATPNALAAATLQQLDDYDNHSRLHEIFTHMHHRLRCNTAEKAAAVIIQMLRRT